MKNCKKLLKANIYIAVFVFLVFVFFYQFFLFGKIPIPADTIVGMYHPFRDVVWDGFKAGVPFKNFLITDPVRQQYVWRKLAISQLEKGNLPLWNPYSFSGTPLLANFQAAPFYPLNILFLVFPFTFAWGILVVLQSLLAGIFLYLYLRSIGISGLSSFLGAFCFSFSGFSISWLEWNTVLHVGLWLPLSLLSVEMIVRYFIESSNKSKINPPGGWQSSISQQQAVEKAAKIHIKSKILIWSLVFVFSLTSSFFAGHLQIFFYSLLVVICYITAKLVVEKQNKLKISLLFAVCFLLFAGIISIQLIPVFKFIVLSARSVDVGSWLKQGWFIPWQNLLQFVAPDFFGNPATGNYWGVWNYAEMVGYIGIIPFIMAVFSMIWRNDRKTMFFGTIFFLSLIFATPTFFAKLPYIFKVPLISGSQPTRLLFLTDFSLAVLAAFGFDYFIKNKSLIVKLMKLLAGIGIFFGLLWFFVIFSDKFGVSIAKENILVARRNLILPTLIFIIGSILIYLQSSSKRKSFLRDVPMYFWQVGRQIVIVTFFLLIIFDLFRFGWKFTPFSRSSWIFPDTDIIGFLRENIGYWRLMSLDRRILPPNFSVYYRFQDVSGYDPLYLKAYGQFVAAWGRDKGDISPASFNRIITPEYWRSFLTDLLGVKYILSFGPQDSKKLENVAVEGDTYLYQNTRAFPRVFLTEKLIKVKSAQKEIIKMFELKENLGKVAVTSQNNQAAIPFQKLGRSERSEIISYQDNYVKVRTNSQAERILVLTDIYYPSWRVSIDGQPAPILRVDFVLRGVVVPYGSHVVEFKNNLL